ncbi:Orexin/Hypocretin receptor type 1, partial [Pseudolycoriella hygida]
TVSVTVSVLTLTFISIDRWYAICFPLRYVSTNIRAVGSIAFIWMVALVSASVPKTGFLESQFLEFLKPVLKTMYLSARIAQELLWC